MIRFRNLSTAARAERFDSLPHVGEEVAGAGFLDAEPAPARVARPWMIEAVCAGSADPDRWFPGSAGPGGAVGARALARVAETKAMCEACPVHRECFEMALDAGEVHGIWGGVNFENKEERNAARGY